MSNRLTRVPASPWMHGPSRRQFISAAAHNESMHPNGFKSLTVVTALGNGPWIPLSTAEIMSLRRPSAIL